MNLLGNAIGAIKPRKDDTLVDRLNYYYSAIIILGLSVTLTAKQYVGQPIQCWVPAEFSKAWEQYAENYCFVYNTYWVKPNEEVPNRVDERMRRQLLYYQWVPFLMALQAGFFHLPILFWSSTNSRSGLNIAAMVEVAQNARQSGGGKENIDRQKAVHAVSEHLEESIRLRQIRRQSSAQKIGFDFQLGMTSGGYVLNMYLFTKCLFILNVCGQFLMMNKFLGQNDALWGVRIFWDVLNGLDWELSGNFPRVSLCDFTVRTLSNVQRYSIQCVLMLNMFNEKIFLFLYWWLLLVGTMTALDAVRWALNAHTTTRRMAYMRKLIRVPPDEMGMFREFCDRVIGSDGTMLLRMIGVNGNELFTQEVLQVLWEEYRAESQLRHVLSAAVATERRTRRGKSVGARIAGTKNEENVDDKRRPESTNSAAEARDGTTTPLMIPQLQ